MLDGSAKGDQEKVRVVPLTVAEVMPLDTGASGVMVTPSEYSG